MQVELWLWTWDLGAGTAYMQYLCHLPGIARLWMGDSFPQFMDTDIVDIFLDYSI